MVTSEKLHFSNQILWLFLGSNHINQRNPSRPRQNSAMLPPSFPDLYAVLGLTFIPSPSKDRIRLAYIRRYRRVRAEKRSFHDSFLKLKHAYNVLSDPRRRAKYDEQYEPRRVRVAALLEHWASTTASLRPPPTLTRSPASRPRSSAMLISGLSQPQPPSHSQLPTASRPDPIAEAYRHGMPPHDGLRLYHGPGFQGGVDQLLREIRRRRAAAAAAARCAAGRGSGRGSCFPWSCGLGRICCTRNGPS